MTTKNPSRILQTKNQRLLNKVTNPEAKHYKAVTVPELELALKEFILIYQDCTILSDAIIVEKAKLLAEKLSVLEGKLNFSAEWLQKFKEQNEICQIKLHREASSVDENVVTEFLLLLHNKCAGTSLSDNLCETNDSELRDLISFLDMFCLLNAIEINEFLNINDEETIKELAYVFKNNKNIEVIDKENIKKMDDSVEPLIISSRLALDSLKN
ncbi:27146_t:CDS:2, partial [Racocetra persica]